MDWYAEKTISRRMDEDAIPTGEVTPIRYVSLRWWERQAMIEGIELWLNRGEHEQTTAVGIR